MSAGGMAWVREHYNVPAKRGGRVRFRGCDAAIISAIGGRLNIRLDSNGNRCHVHPTWEMEYLPVGAAVGETGP